MMWSLASVPFVFNVAVYTLPKIRRDSSGGKLLSMDEIFEKFLTLSYMIHMDVWNFEEPVMTYVGEMWGIHFKNVVYDMKLNSYCVDCEQVLVQNLEGNEKEKKAKRKIC